MRSLFVGLAALPALAACGTVSPPFGTRLPAGAAFWAFAAPWDPRSAESAARHGTQLDAIVSGWIAIDSSTALPYLAFADTAARAGARRMALVTSWQGERFHPETVRRLAADSALLARAAHEVGTMLAAGNYAGVVLDLEGHAPGDVAALHRVARAFGDAARARQAGPVVMAVPAADTAAYPGQTLATAADLLLVMLYDEHWAGSPPGPVASPEWVRRNLALRIAEVGAARLVAAFPLYGYQWRPGDATAVIGHEDARRIAAEAGVTLRRDPASRTLRARRDGAPGWELWVSDADLVAALVRAAARAGVTTFAFWRLGLEDEALWRDVVGRREAPR